MSDARKPAIVAGICLLVTIYAAYETAYFAWLTATPLLPGQLPKMQRHAYFWFAVFFIGLVGVIASGIRWWLANKRDRIAHVRA